MEKPRIQIDDLGNSREMTDEEIAEYAKIKPHDLTIDKPEP
jgi:hypothetical protein